MAIEIRTDLSPTALLAVLKTAEKQLGRTPGERRWGPRKIDLDILIYDDLILDTPDLTVPHASLTSREFVLQHLRELAPELIDPRTGRLFSDFLDNT